jgi:Kef-type K+ transport system membrane component KefB
LLIVAIASAFITLRLGVYYLVGAFIVGITAQRFRESLPALASDKMIHAIEVFAAFFIPFYFFSAELHITREDLAPNALLLGGLMSLIVIPLRLASVIFHRRAALKETFKKSARVGVSILPNLVFALVIAVILRTKFGAKPEIIGGLIVCTIICTAITSFILKIPPPDFETPHKE